jgi:Ni,Fe-hydrogenase maturation factor
VIYGVEAKCFKLGEGLSSEVEKALPQLVKQVMAELEQSKTV